MWTINTNTGNEKRKAKLLGVACEKPLARNLAEAKRLVQLAHQSKLISGYLENQVFAPSLVKVYQNEIRTHFNNSSLFHSIQRDKVFEQLIKTA